MNPADKMKQMPTVAAIMNHGGHPVAVGGCVRDYVLGCDPKDLDIEIYGLPLEKLMEALTPFRPSIVGKAFGVIKAHDPYCGEIDFSLPRKENKIGATHRDFAVQADPNMTFKEAAQRRDFTINAMGMNIDGILIDPFGGLQDAQNRIIRHVGHQFSEDSLRILRACRFASKLGFAIHYDTIDECRKMAHELENLPGERVFEEIKKLLLGQAPHIGLHYLAETGALQHVFPEVHALIGVPQDALWHPEGDAFTHTKHVVAAAGRICKQRGFDQEETISVMFAALLHDVGKAKCTTIIDGRIKSPDHEAESAAMSLAIMDRLRAPSTLGEQVCGLCALHMAFDRDGSPTLKAVRHIAKRLSNFGLTIEMWSALIEADHHGRPPLPGKNPVAEYEAIEANDKAKIYPLLKGRHLISLGLQPGPHFGPILSEVYGKQIEGEISTLDEAIEMAKKVISKQ